MKCPSCGGSICVISTRKTDPDTISRLRSCNACGHRWTTAEISLPLDAGEAVKHPGLKIGHWHVKFDILERIQAAAIP